MNKMLENVTIYRKGVSGEEVVYPNLPIYEGGVRRWQLQGDDYITLKIKLPNAIPFQIGDYFTDEQGQWGEPQRYYITSPVFPSYSSSNGAWEYELKFEAEYKLWGNKVLRFIASHAEGEFSLTDTIDHHLDLVLATLKHLGLNICNGNGKEYEYIIHYDGSSLFPRSGAVEKSVKLIQYSNTNILQALDKIAEKWECEWWMEGNIIHLGYCENDEESFIDASLDDNVVSWSVDQSKGSYITRVFPFGSTKNIPENYRKKLDFKITDVAIYDEDNSGNPYIAIKDASHKLSESYFSSALIDAGADSYSFEISSKVDNTSTESSPKRFSKLLETRNLEAYKKIDVSSWQVTIKAKNTQTGQQQSIGSNVLHYKLYVVTGITTSGSKDEITYIIKQGSVPDNGVLTFNETTDYQLQGSRVAELRFEVYGGISNHEYYILSQGLVKTSYKAPVSDWTSKQHPRVTINVPGNTTTNDVYINPSIGGSAVEDKQIFKMSEGWFVIRPKTKADGTARYGSTESEVKANLLNREFVMIGLLEYKLPIAWFLNEYKEDTPTTAEGMEMLNNITDKRLMLPNGLNCVEMSGLNEWQHIEEIKIFDDIFPNEELHISAIETRDRYDIEEHSDGEKTEKHWKQYRVQLSDKQGRVFFFCDDYLAKDGSTLTISFLTDNENTSSTSKLAGMDFEVRFNPDGYSMNDSKSQWFEIVRNTTYGSDFPNETLCPKVGDSVLLYGIDLRAMAATGVVEAAEKKLKAKAEEYLKKARIDDRTYTISFASNFAFENMANLMKKGKRVSIKDPAITGSEMTNCTLIDADGNTLTDKGGKILVSLDFTEVAKSARESRIIGFELKSDIPYDTPQIMCGVSGIYSRLADIEHKLRKENKNGRS